MKCHLLLLDQHANNLTPAKRKKDKTLWPTGLETQEHQAGLAFWNANQEELKETVRGLGALGSIPSTRGTCVVHRQTSRQKVVHIK